MALKVLVYVMLAYLLVRAVANLVRAMAKQRQGNVGARGRPPRFGQQQRGNAARQNGHAREGEESERATRLRDEEDIEDARWEDL